MSPKTDSVSFTLTGAIAGEGHLLETGREDKDSRAALIDALGREIRRPGLPGSRDLDPWDGGELGPGAFPVRENLQTLGGHDIR